MAKGNSQKAACDRCRGQKLRCSWDPKEPQCQRCARANAVCTIPPPRPMGRPPRRQHRNQTNNNYASNPQDQNQNLYRWNEQSAACTPPVSDEDPDIVMNSANVLSDPLEFLPWFPEPDGLNFFAPRGAMPQPMTAPPPTPSETATINNNHPFTQQNGAFAATVSDGGKQTDGNYPNPAGIDDGAPMNFTSPGSEESAEDQIQLLRQLCELNVALFQHPLYRERDKSCLQTMLSPHPEDATPREPVRNPPGDDSSGTSNGCHMIEPNVNDLQTGNLFEMTCRLKDIITQIRTLDEAAGQGAKRYDRSTALMALSCYTRLDLLYSRALDILARLRNNGPIAENTFQVMPELVIDGFSLGRCPDLQLSFLIHLHEKARDRIRSCIRSAEGDGRVGRDRRDPARQLVIAQAA
ncbi:hypothetical protein C7999DRAFT_32339 [Corynascus novoguineensis]|uniref:Zn(2)-C6 fungal-type domain-containing protein n=1 Tax=Corynascus novoguineensis TaxID=1126955 RepID=A0AAN7CU25_9PEZI|nr:hypothetical protein C7999DRAFT_32339 [Corynascus novoguineensis]